MLQMDGTSSTNRTEFVVFSMLNVLIDYGNALAQTGIGTYARSLLAGLQNYLADEINAEEAGVSVPASSLRPLRRLVYMGKLSLLRRRGYGGFHIIHFANSYVPKRRPGVGYVVTIYDLDTLLESGAHSRRYVLYYKAIHRKIIARSDRIVTISNTVRNEIIDYFQLDESRVRTGGIGISPDFANLAQATDKTLPLQPTILFVGTINKKKNIAWLVRNIANGVRTGAIPKVGLVLAGSRGFGFDEVESELRIAGDIVQWKSGLSMQEIVELYCNSSAVVLPSLREGFGLPLLEAMCCDKPIIASRIPSSVEVTNGAANFFSLGDVEEFYEAIKSALADSNAAQRKTIATQQLDKYSWRHIARAHADVYKEVRERFL